MSWRRLQLAVGPRAVPEMLLWLRVTPVTPVSQDFDMRDERKGRVDLKLGGWHSGLTG